MAKKKNTLFECQHCGEQSSKWLGKCPSCDSWDSFIELSNEQQEVLKQTVIASNSTSKARPITQIEQDDVLRFSSFNDEFDLVLGGGVVPGSLTLIGGSPGVGKTHLATSIGIEAAQNRNSTYFINCNDLIANLKKAQSENRFINRLNHYARYKVLIIDEVGFLPMDLDGANMLFQLINKRYEKHSTIITTNKPFGKWHEIFNDVTLANAILDRLLHHSHIININGNSYRLKDKLKIDSDVSEPMHN